jgi:hypothetical protein
MMMVASSSLLVTLEQSTTTDLEIVECWTEGMVMNEVKKINRNPGRIELVFIS